MNSPSTVLQPRIVATVVPKISYQEMTVCIIMRLFII